MVLGRRQSSPDRKKIHRKKAETWRASLMPEDAKQFLRWEGVIMLT